MAPSWRKNTSTPGTATPAWSRSTTAIASGLVDLALPTAAMAGKLVAYARGFDPDQPRGLPQKVVRTL